MSSTARLARQLGLVRSRRVRDAKNSGNSKQRLDYLLILDFESTCWKDKSASAPPEIIEFPAVLLCLSTGTIVSEFQEYVQPVENPRLSNFCTDLTGITQNLVDQGIPLGTCLVLFNRWLTKVGAEYNCTAVGSRSADATADVPKLYSCCTWSDWDLNLCLEQECRRKQLRKPEELKDWIDIRAVYKGFYDRKPKGLKGALEELGMKFVGREHSGIEDARNTARLVLKMVRDGCLLEVTSTSRTRQDSPGTGMVTAVNGPGSEDSGSDPHQSGPGPHESPSGGGSRTKYRYDPHKFARQRLGEVKIAAPKFKS